MRKRYDLYVILGHRVRLVPTRAQVDYFVRACGVARFAYNWGLSEWERQHAAGQRPSVMTLQKQLNAVKRDRFPWMLEVTKNAPQEALRNLGSAYRAFFCDIQKARSGEITWKRVRRPKFKKKGLTERFRADSGTEKSRPNGIKTDGKRVKLPRVGWVQMREELRFAGRVVAVTINRQADAWYASFCIDVAYEPDAHCEKTIIGVDLGITVLTTISDGSTVSAPKPLSRYVKKLKRLSRSLSRKRHGSRNRAKAKTKLARLHARIANIRGDVLHKLTSKLVNHGTIVIEDLSVRNLLANRRVARAINDVGFFEFRRQLTYKTKIAGSTLIVASRWYPSSKMCSGCRAINESLALSERTWTCISCGAVHDRDLNAARNLARYAESSPASACGAEGAGGEPGLATKPAA